MSPFKDQRRIEQEAKDACLRELNMTEAELDRAVENTNLWLQQQPHLPHTVDTRVLRAFINGCRSVEVAKEKIEKYFMARVDYPDEMANRDPTKIAWEKIQPLAFLPDLTPEGCLVLLLTMPDLNKMASFDFVQTIRYLAMTGELLMRERPYITGLVCLVDLKYLSLKLVPKLSLTHVSNALYIFDNVFPFIMSSIYNFNAPQIADTLQRNIMKPLMSDGYYNMIIGYTQDESCLANHMPVEILPRDYGGNAPALHQIMRDWKVKLENAASLFSGECSLLPDQTKTPKTLMNESSFGSSGTFRKLNVD